MGLIIVAFFKYRWSLEKPWYHSDTFKEQRCRVMDPIAPLNLAALSPLRRERFYAVQAAIAVAWKGCVDDVSPHFIKGSYNFLPDCFKSKSISKSAEEETWSYVNHRATLYGFVDTLYIANLTEEYNEAVDMLTSYDIQTTLTCSTKTSEYSQITLGGLLGAYSVSGDPRLFATAQNAANSLWEAAFQDSPTAIPFSTAYPIPLSFGWKASIHRLYKSLHTLWLRIVSSADEHGITLGDLGSFGLEFSFLSTISGEPKYHKSVNAIFRHLTKDERDGMVPSRWNTITGEPERKHVGFATFSRSFYENLVKVPIVTGCHYDDGMEMFSDECSLVGKDHLELFFKTVQDSLWKGYVKNQSVAGLDALIHADFGDQGGHPLCFLPGLLALTAHTQGRYSQNDDLALAKDLFHVCNQLYSNTLVGLPTNSGDFVSGKQSQLKLDHVPSDFVESLWILYEITKDEALQEIGWNVFLRLERHSNIPSNLNAELNDANNNNPGAGNNEDLKVLKFLLLLFAPDGYVSLDEFVFTAGGHPIRITKLEELEAHDPYCVFSSRPPVPVPWTLLTLCVLFFLFIIGGSTMFVCSSIQCILLKMRQSKRKTL